LKIVTGYCFLPILFNLYKHLTSEAPEGFGDFKIVGQVIRTVKYAYDLVLLAEEKTVLQGIFERLIEIGKFCGMEMKAGGKKTKLMGITREQSV
jgi:hypothetical protein